MLTLGYSSIVGSQPGDGPVLRRAGYEARLVDGLDGASIISDVFTLGLARVGPDSPCFGTRFRTDGSVGAFQWHSYAQVAERIAHFALGLQSMQLVPPASSADTLRALGFFARNSAEWVVGALACYRLGIVVVPMYDTLGPDTVRFIAAQTGASAIICYPTGLATVLAVGARAGGPLRTAIVIGAPSAQQRTDAAAAGVALHTFAEVEARGAAGLARASGAPVDTLLPRKPSPDSLALLCYTSGTTGEPKGAMLTHRQILASVASAQLVGLGEPASGEHDWYLSYLPLAHIFETAVLAGNLAIGAAIGFSQARAATPRGARRHAPRLAASLARAHVGARGARRHDVRRRWGVRPRRACAPSSPDHQPCCGWWHPPQIQSSHAAWRAPSRAGQRERAPLAQPRGRGRGHPTRRAPRAPRRFAASPAGGRATRSSSWTTLWRSAQPSSSRYRASTRASTTRSCRAWSPKVVSRGRSSSALSARSLPRWRTRASGRTRCGTGSSSARCARSSASTAAG